MGTSTGSATNNMPRITDKWGKYAKKDSGTNTTTTVSTSGTTVTTNAKNVKVNIFNGQPPQKPGNVIYKNRTFNIPKNIWGSPYPFAGMGGMNFDAMPMPSIFGGFGGGCKGHNLDNWDRFYQFTNGPVSGPVSAAALGGLAMGIGKALMGDDKKASKADDSSKIKGYYNGTPGTSSTSGSSSSSSANTPKQTEKFDKITEAGFENIDTVKNYNNSLPGLETKQTAVTAARSEVANKQTAADNAARALREHQVKVTNLHDAYDKAQAAFDKVKDADPKPENYDSLKTAAEDAKKAYEDAKADTTAQDAKDKADGELKTANEAVAEAERNLASTIETVRELKAKAEKQIKFIKDGSGGKNWYGGDAFGK